MRYSVRAQPAPLVRGSSRRIMTLRFQPAYIRVINRRLSSIAAICPALQKEKRLRSLLTDERSPKPINEKTLQSYIILCLTSRSISEQQLQPELDLPRRRRSRRDHARRRRRHCR